MAENIRHRGGQKRNPLLAYFLHHLQSMVFSLGKLYSSPTTTLMTVAVIAITLSLPGGFYLFLKNIQTLSGDLRSTTQITLYLNRNLSFEKAQSLNKKLQKQSNISFTKLISKTEALDEFRKSSGFGRSIDGLSENPLPHTLIVQPQTTDDAFLIKQLLNQLKIMPEVELAKMDTDWLNKLYAILDIASRIVGLITILFSFAVLLIIGNTIRLDIQNRYQEIVVAKLIGATDSFIRRPFIYGGIWYGLFGGFLSWLIVEIATLLISGPVNRLSIFYQTDLKIINFSFQDFLILICSSTLLGLAGSWVAVARHLNEIEPK